MSRLPSRLQPAWPYLKRAHRLLALLLGVIFRLTSPLAGKRGVPRTATTASMETARREPDVVTVHPGGPGQQLTRRNPVGDPGDHWVFARSRSAQLPARYTLEVREGRLTGDFGATSTPGGALDYQTSGYFGISGWREHPIYLRPHLGRVERVEGTALSLVTRGTSVNYYHFLYDAIGRYGIFEEAMPGTQVDSVIVAHAANYQRQLLELARIPEPWLQPAAGVTYVPDRLLVPSTPNQDLDAPPWVVEWLRERLPAQPNADTPRRLYLTRGDKPNTRRYIEEPALLPDLERRGFVRLDPGTLSVQEQINVFHGAEMIVAPHGAGLTNITFCSPGAKVVEMFAPTYVHLGLANIAAAIDGVDYEYLIGEGRHREGRPMVGVLDDVSIPPKRVLEAIDRLLG